LPAGSPEEILYAELGNELQERMVEIETVTEPSIDHLRNYTVIGDPAVRLAV
jgi:hypothetical protein